MSEAGRERKVITVLFADLVGLTTQAEQLDPEDVEAILRPYHEPTSSFAPRSRSIGRLVRRGTCERARRCSLRRRNG